MEPRDAGMRQSGPQAWIWSRFSSAFSSSKVRRMVVPRVSTSTACENAVDSVNPKTFWSSSTPESSSNSVSNPVARSGPVSMNKDDYPVFPDSDAGADAAVPADQGGKGFTGEGWETNTNFDLIGDPHAVKGGMLREATTD